MIRHAAASLPCLWMVAACASSPPPAPAAAAAAATASEPDADAQPRPGDPEVHLLEAGAAPREPLRYHLTPGAPVVAVMDMQMTLSMQIGAMSPPPIRAPLVRMSMSFEVTGTRPGRAVTLRSRVTAVEVKPGPDDPSAMVAAMKPQLDALVGLETTWVMTPRGFVRDAKVSVPGGVQELQRSMIESMRSVAEQASGVLPAESVGAGARWEVKSKVDSGPLKLDQTALMTLQSRQGDTIRLAIDLRQSAGPQPMRLTTLPPGTSAMLESHTGKGGGNTEARLDWPVPRASLSIDGTTRANMLQGEARTLVVTNSGVQISLGPAPAGP